MCVAAQNNGAHGEFLRTPGFDRKRRLDLSEALALAECERETIVAGSDLEVFLIVRRRFGGELERVAEARGYRAVRRAGDAQQIYFSLRASLHVLEFQRVGH